MYVLLYWAYIVVCCAKRFLLMSDNQKAFLYHTVACNITGNWFHSAVGGYFLVIVKWVYTLVIVKIPHGLVMLASSIQNFNLRFWILSKAILYGCHFPKTNRTEQTVSPNRTHAGHSASIFLYDCDFYLYYTLVLYSLIMICMFPLFIFYQSWSQCVVSFRGKTRVYFISS